MFNLDSTNSFTDKQIREARDILWQKGILYWKLDACQKKIYDFYMEKSKTNKTIVINASRRLGKSYVLLIIATEICIKNPGTNIRFVQPTRDMIKDNLNPDFEMTLEDCPLEIRPTFKTQGNVWLFPNGSRIRLAGTDGKNYNKLRGGNADICIVDEAGFCSDLSHIIKYILMPLTTQTRGKIILSSTTPTDPDHEFNGIMDNAEIAGTLIRKTFMDAVEDQKTEPAPRLTMEIAAEIMAGLADSGGENSDAWRTEYMCVDARTPIRTESGFKSISEITAGEKVLTHLGNFKSVKEVFKNPLGNRKVFFVKCSNNEGFKVTEGHQLYIRQTDWSGKVIFEGFKKVEEIDMDSWTRVYFKNPILNKTVSYVDDDLAYLSGWFVAEGHTNKTQQQVIFSLNDSDPRHELSEICYRKFGKPLKCYPGKTIDSYALNSKIAKEYFDQFGRGASNKFIPDFIKYSSNSAKIAFLRGLFMGDGCIKEGKTGDSYSLSTVSQTLAYDVSELLLSVGIMNSLRKCNRPKKCVIEGRTVNQRDNYIVDVTGPAFKKMSNLPVEGKSKNLIENDYFYSKISKIEIIDYSESYVYDIEVEDDHSYVSVHGTFHNCERIFNSTDAVLPEFTAEIQNDCITEWPRPLFYDRYTAQDLGFADLTVVLFAYWDFDNGVLVIEDEYVQKQGRTSDLAENIMLKEKKLWTNPVTREFQEPYMRISDNNLQIIHDLQMDYDLFFLPTEKHNKLEYMQRLREMVRNRQVIINPKCKTLISHMKSATWDKAKKDFKRSPDNGHYDAVAALLYLSRNIDKTRNPYPTNYNYSKLGSPSQVFKNEYRSDSMDIDSRFRKLSEAIPKPKSSFKKKINK